MTSILIPQSGSIPVRFAWDNALDDATSIVASTSATGFPVENIATWRVFEQWLATALPATVTVTWSAARPINCFCLFGHQIGVRGAQIQAEYYDGAWNNFESAILPASTEVIYIYGDTVSASQARITITGTTPPEIGNLFIGYDFQPNAGIQPGFQPPAGAQDPSTREAISRNGLWRGATIEDYSAQTSLTISPIEEADAISNWRPFRKQCQKIQPFYMHWNVSIDAQGAAFMSAADFNGMPYMTPGFQAITITARAEVE